MHTSLTESQLQRKTDPSFRKDEAGAVLTVCTCIRDISCSIFWVEVFNGVEGGASGVSPRGCGGSLEIDEESLADKRKSMIHSH
jgi:hypothetical protein